MLQQNVIFPSDNVFMVVILIAKRNLLSVGASIDPTECQLFCPSPSFLLLFSTDSQIKLTLCYVEKKKIDS